MKLESLLHQSITLTFHKKTLSSWYRFIQMHLEIIIVMMMVIISIYSFIYYSQTHVVLAYNDARSHLDIARRVVDGLKTGFSQLGSVWLPLFHIMMIPTIWNDFMWHTGLSGALVSMISYVVTGVCIYQFLSYLKVSFIAKLMAVFLFTVNLNILYLQSTAMTELLLLSTMTISSFTLVKWTDSNDPFDLLKTAFWVMLATLIRYDGWFLFGFVICLIVIITIRRHELKNLEGIIIFFSTLGAFGILAWFVWNQLIFKNALYFAFGPFSAHAQQEILLRDGRLPTIGHFWLSLKYYTYAVVYNSNTFISLLGLAGAAIFWLHKRYQLNTKIAMVVLLAPFVFNVLALYLGHSVLYIQGLWGDTWFNVRYGTMMTPSISIFTAFLIDRLKKIRVVLIGLILFVTLFSITSSDAVTIDDAHSGASQKDVSLVSNWLRDHAKNQDGFVLVAVASHDAVIFSSGLPMSRFIHEGTGEYWNLALKDPSHWARWIVLRTDQDDFLYRELSKTNGLANYNLMGKYPFANVYQVKDEYWNQTINIPILGKQK